MQYKSGKTNKTPAMFLQMHKRTSKQKYISF